MKDDPLMTIEELAAFLQRSDKAVDKGHRPGSEGGH